MRKRIVAFLLASIFIFGLMPVGVFAEEQPISNEEFALELDDMDFLGNEELPDVELDDESDGDLSADFNPYVFSVDEDDNVSAEVELPPELMPDTSAKEETPDKTEEPATDPEDTDQAEEPATGEEPDNSEQPEEEADPSEETENTEEEDAGEETEEAEEENSETDQEKPQPVIVIFNLNHEDALLEVYSTTDIEDVQYYEPEEDGSYLLLPGEYYYSAEAEGYFAVYDVAFTVEASEEPIELKIELKSESDAVRVVFILDPEDAWLEVYSMEDGEITHYFEPEEDGSYLLLPGEYFYYAEAEGYLSLEDEPFTVEESEEPIEIKVFLDWDEDGAQVLTSGVQYSYDSEAAADWAAVDANVKKYKSDCGKFVVQALIQGGIKDKGLPAARDDDGCRGLMTYLLKTTDYATEYFITEDNYKDIAKIIKRGDIIAVRTKSTYGCNHVIFVTKVTDSGIVFSAANTGNDKGYRCGPADSGTKKFSALPDYYSSWTERGATRTSLISMNSTGVSEERKYLESCKSYDKNNPYPSYAKLTVISNNPTTAKSLPCSASTNSASENRGTYSKGDTLTATALWKNPEGNYWYEVQSQGKRAFIFAGDVKADAKYDCGKVTGTVKAPSGQYKLSDLKNGKDLSGTIDAGYLELATVGAYVRKNTGSYYEPNAVTGLMDLSVPAGTKTWSITKDPNGKKSSLDDNCKFGTLGVGAYQYCITATFRNNIATGAKTKATYTSFDREYLKTFDFSVVNDAVKYTLSYNANGGSNPPTAHKDVIAGTSVTLKAAGDMTRSGYVFAGWMDDKACYQPGDKYPVTGSTTLKAVWREQPHIHTPGSPVRTVKVQPTCTSSGLYEDTTYCTGCGQKISSVTGSLSATGHSWGAWAVTKSATCTEEGTETRVCVNNSSHKETRSIAKAPHQTELRNAKKATRTEEGYTGDEVCVICGQIIKNGQVIPRLTDSDGAIILYDGDDVIMNLEGGLKFKPERSGTISLGLKTAEAGGLWVSLTANNDTMWLAIWDQGIEYFHEQVYAGNVYTLEYDDRFENDNLPVEIIVDYYDMDACGEDAHWSTDGNGTLTISGTGETWMYYGWYGPDVTLPYSPWRNIKDEIHTVVVEEGINGIGYNGITGLGNLNTLFLPKSLYFIYPDAFRSSPFKTVYYAGTEAEWADVDVNPDLFADADVICSDTGIPSKGLTYSIANSEVTITGYTDKLPVDVEIPAEIEGVPVVKIEDNAFFGNENMTSIIVPEGVKDIGANAFDTCSSLASALLPNGLIHLGESAFQNCASLTNITIPGSVESINSNMFSRCETMTDVQILDGVTMIDSGAFAQCSSLVNIIIPESVTRIAQSAFEGCTSLQTVYYNGSKSTWEKIRIGTGNDCLTEAECIYGKEDPHKHTPGETVIENTISPSCTEAGEHVEVVYCLECGEIVSASRITDAPLDHDWDEWTIIKEPTCSEEGLETRNCRRDPSHIESRSIEKLAHQTELRGVKEATETEEGYTGDEVCTVCSEIVNIGRILPKLTESYEYAGRIALNEGKYVLLPETGARWQISAVQVWKLSSSTGGWQASDEMPGFAVIGDDGVLTAGLLPDQEYAWIFSVYSASDYETTLFDILVIPSSWTEFILGNDVTEIADYGFADNSNLVYVGIADTVTQIGDHAFDGRSEELLIGCNPDSYAEQFAIAHGLDIWYFGEDLEYSEEEPDEEPVQEIKLDREYLLMAPGETLDTPLRIQNVDQGLLFSTEWASDNTDVATVDSYGYVTAVGVGKANIIASFSIDGTEYKAQCRIDVAEEYHSEMWDENWGLWGAVSGFEVSDPNVTVKVFSTDYAQIHFKLDLPQNYAQNYAQNYGIMVIDEPVNTGFAIKRAFFGDDESDGINQLFDLRVVDDRTLEVIPKHDTMRYTAANASYLKGSYKTEIRVVMDSKDYWGDGSWTAQPLTGTVTLKIDKTLPKVTAKVRKLNSLLDNDRTKLEFSGETINFLYAESVPGWISLDEQDGTLTYIGSRGAKQSGKVSFLAACDGWAYMKEITVNVTAAPTEPKVTIKPSSLTLLSGSYDTAKAQIAVSPEAFQGYDISVSKIMEGSSSITQNVLEFELIDDGFLYVSPGPDLDTAKAHTYKVFLSVAGVDKYSVTVKTQPATSKVTLGIKAAGAIDTGIPNSPVTLTMMPKGFNAGSGETYYFRVVRQMGKQPEEEVAILTSTETVNDITADMFGGVEAGYTYSVYTSMDYGAGETDEIKTKLTIKTTDARKVTPQVTLKTAGKIDVIRPDTSVTITPTLKNIYGYEPELNSLCFWKKSGSKYTQVGTGENSDIFYTELSDTGFEIWLWEGSGVNHKTDKFFVTLTVTDTNGKSGTSKYAAIPLTMGSVKLAQSTKAITLLKNDIHSSGTIIITVSEEGLTELDMAKTTVNNKAYQLKELGYGKYVISYNGARDKSFKSTNLQLSVWLNGNETTTANAKLSLKVNVA